MKLCTNCIHNPSRIINDKMSRACWHCIGCSEWNGGNYRTTAQDRTTVKRKKNEMSNILTMKSSGMNTRHRNCWRWKNETK